MRVLNLIIIATLVSLPNFTLAATQKQSTKPGGGWSLSATSVVSLKGVESTSEQCEAFEVKVGKQLEISLKCGELEEDRNLSLTSDSNYSVNRNKKYTTITKYAYMAKNHQISQLKQATLKVPYVKEIIHLKVDEQGKMAFYSERFKVDEFGRVVQDRLIQAHSLVTAKSKKRQM